MSLRTIYILLKREFFYYFFSPLIYLLLTAFFFLSGWQFYSYLTAMRDINVMSPYLNTWTFLSLFLVPALTMRVVAEEKRSGSIELLVTAPVREHEIVIAKFLGVLIFFIFLFIPTLVYIGILSTMGNVDEGRIIADYLAMLLSAMFLISIGIFFSTITSNQVIAFVLTLVASLTLVFLPLLGQQLSEDIVKISQYVSLPHHITSLMNGVFDTRDIVYFLTGTIFFLFLSFKILETRRWK